MRKSSHKTVIGVVRDYLDQWRRERGLSLQAAAGEIVEHYFASGMSKVWPVDFHTGGDAYAAIKANSERIWRWLDDQTKDTTLLPANMLPVVMGVLPFNLRMMCVNELLGPIGLSVSIRQGVLPAVTHAQVLAVSAKESGEAIAALAGLADGWTPQELAAVRAELQEATAAYKAALTFVDSLADAESDHAA
ncbi:hypothetical protein JW897_12200 [Chromobacterium alkanivorans]|uniref:hypothetical protein n=1 Tax=Chromobacterium alkanivorans TaxID=1071719 RepID=UPI0019672A56|nr:hypothetical protein [Chromobacterium alkanivorans]MBN3004497.1 hypothetical protein [Chromobacterium alkanivorans]